jgi:hypothetical protein
MASLNILIDNLSIMSITIYIKDLAGNMITCDHSLNDPPSKIYSNLYMKNVPYHPYDQLILLDPSQDDPYDLSTIHHEKELSIFVTDIPFHEKWSYQKDIKIGDIPCIRVLCYWYCALWGDPYTDPFVTQTHCTLPLYILSKKEGTGFCVGSTDFSYQTSVYWSPTIREALVRYQNYMNMSRKEEGKGMTDQIVDHLVCLWYRNLH